MFNNKMPHELSEKELIEWTYNIRAKRAQRVVTKSKFKKKGVEEKSTVSSRASTKLVLNDGKLVIG